jgi:hypothetical protein
MTCSIGMAALAAVSVFVALAAGMHAVLVRRGLRKVRDLEAGIDGDRDPKGLRRALGAQLRELYGESSVEAAAKRDNG